MKTAITCSETEPNFLCSVTESLLFHDPGNVVQVDFWREDFLNSAFANEKDLRDSHRSGLNKTSHTLFQKMIALLLSSNGQMRRFEVN